MGVRPSWDAASRRVTGFEVLPLSILDRPRVDVTLRISGFFRDAFPSQIDLVDSRGARGRGTRGAARAQPAGGARREGRKRAHKPRCGRSDGAPARRPSRFRLQARGLWCGAPGPHRRARLGRGGRSRARLSRLGRLCLRRGGRGRCRASPVRAPPRRGRRRRPQPGQPRARSSRFRRLLPVRGRARGRRAPSLGARAGGLSQRSLAPRTAANPHPRRGDRARRARRAWSIRNGSPASCATATRAPSRWRRRSTISSPSRRPRGAVGDHHFDAVYEAYLADERVRGFLTDNNPAAAREMAERLLEAEARGLWRPRSNSAHPHLAALAAREPEKVP